MASTRIWDRFTDFSPFFPFKSGLWITRSQPGSARAERTGQREDEEEESQQEFPPGAPNTRISAIKGSMERKFGRSSRSRPKNKQPHPGAGTRDRLLPSRSTQYFYFPRSFGGERTRNVLGRGRGSRRFVFSFGSERCKGFFYFHPFLSVLAGDGRRRALMDGNLNYPSLCRS